MGTVETVLLADSVTRLPASVPGQVAVCGSHAGRFSAKEVLSRRLSAVVLHDARRGLDDAGIAGLAVLDQYQVAAVAVAGQTALIGDALDVLLRGSIGAVNRHAENLGVAVGDTAEAALRRLRAAPLPAASSRPRERESRCRIDHEWGPTWALDSVSLVNRRDADAVVVTGSHAACLGGNPATAMRESAVGAIFNDAGAEPHSPGTSRLDALDARGIPAAAVSYLSAHIGDGRSSYDTGIISCANSAALRSGIRPGMTAVAAAALMHQAMKSSSGPSASIDAGRRA